MNWSFEMQLETNTKTLTFIAKTKKERHFWIGEFSRAIELGDSESPIKIPTITTPGAFDSPNSKNLILNLNMMMKEEEEGSPQEN